MHHQSRQQAADFCLLRCGERLPHGGEAASRPLVDVGGRSTSASGGYGRIGSSRMGRHASYAKL